MKYTGEICPACRKKFTEMDDIVVCPECATPHHRKCYRENGECVNRIRHGEKFNWNTENSVKGKIENVQDVSEESVHVEKIEITTVPEFIESNIKALDKGEKDGCTLKEILSFVHRNVLYYIPVFTRIRNMGVNVSFNLVCFLFPQAYFANRKMWFWAMLTTVLSVILVIPAMIGIIASDASALPTGVAQSLNSNAGLINSLMEICNGADLIMRAVLCLFGNKLYYNFAVKSIRRMKKNSENDITKEQLACAGGTSFANIILIVLATFALTLCTMFLLQSVLPVIF